MKYEKTIVIPKEYVSMINNWFTEPTDEDNFNDNYMNEDETYTKTAKFENGYEMDIKICGISDYEKGGSNTMWSEAVLFDETGVELTCSEPEDSYFGIWELEYDGDTFVVEVKPE